MDFCVCVRVRHHGHVPAAALPELHSQDHQQLARLTTRESPAPRWTASPSQHGRTEAWSWGWLGGGWVWLYWVPEAEPELNSNHTISNNIFCKEIFFFSVLVRSEDMKMGLWQFSFCPTLNGLTPPLCSPLHWSEDALISTSHDVKA